MHSSHLLSRALALLAVGSAAIGQSFNVDVNPMFGVPSPIYAGAGAPGTWTAVPAAASGPHALLDSMGTAGPVTLETTGGSAFGFNNAGTSADAQALLDDLQSFNQPLAWTVRGLEPGTWQVITYAWAPDFPTDLTRVTVVAANEPPQDVGGAWPGMLMPGVTHAVHTVQIGPGAALVVRAAPANALFGSINGFQLERLAAGSATQRFCRADGPDANGCTPCPCGNDAVMPGLVGGCLNAEGRSARIQPGGLASASNDSLRFGMTGGTEFSFGVLVSGATRLPNSPANPCFGLDLGLSNSALDGLRCVADNLIRHGARPTDMDGSIGVLTNGWGPPAGPPGGLIAAAGFTPGQIRHFQVFYRVNPAFACGSGQNTSDAFSLTIQP